MKQAYDEQDMLLKINLLLDNELEENLAAELRDLIAATPLLSEMYQHELRFRGFVRSRLAQMKMPPSRIQAIRDEILNSPLPHPSSPED
jgi:hypothetical protein